MGAVTPPYTPKFGTGAPAIPVVQGALYFDTSVKPYNVYVGNAGIWQQCSNDGVPIAALVQSAAVATGVNVVLGAAPTNGNKLISLFTTGGQAAGTPNAGWVQEYSSALGGNNFFIFSKTAGVGESTSQGPTATGAQFGCMSVFEVANYNGYDANGAQNAGTTATVALSITTPGADRLVLGLAYFAQNTVTGFPTVNSGGQLVATSNNANRKGILYKNVAPTAGAYNTIIGNVAGPPSLGVLAASFH